MTFDCDLELESAWESSSSARCLTEMNILPKFNGYLLKSSGDMAQIQNARLKCDLQL